MDEAGLRIEVQRCPQGGLRFVEPAIYRTAQAEKAPAGAAQELERFVRAPEYAGEARNPAQHVGVVWRESQRAASGGRRPSSPSRGSQPPGRARRAPKARSGARSSARCAASRAWWNPEFTG